MDQLRGYMLTVITGAMLIGLLTGIADKKSAHSSVIRFIGGLFLVFTIVSPVANLDFSGIRSFMEDFSVDADAASGQGQKKAQDAMGSIIKKQTEAYILDKADMLHAELKVEVELSEEAVPSPVSVRLQGDVSPYVKSSLEQLMESDLGISKENQLWIG